MEHNPIEAWWQKDKRLSDLLVSIDEQHLSEEESGREAFYKVAALYHLPKLPQDVVADEEEAENGRSVFEEIALARFLFPEDEYRGIVMMALYNVYIKSYIPYNEVAAIHFGSHDNIPDSYFLYFFGKDVNAIVKFDIGEQTWLEAGAVYMIQIFNSQGC
jgi:hypothetical protein